MMVSQVCNRQFPYACFRKGDADALCNPELSIDVIVKSFISLMKPGFLKLITFKKK